ncbi:MAG: elongation factor G [Myxococcota bacterium]
MTQQVRNIGIIAHVDAGKTTLTERVLFYTGRIHAMGRVDSGNTTTDSDALEQRKGITIKAAAVRCEWDHTAIHLIDTPGHADFNIEVERSLRVLDGAVVVLDGVAGVEPQTEKVWRQADRHRVPRIVFINKLDRAGASFEASLESIRKRLGLEPTVVGLPVGIDSGELGLVDLIRMHELRWHDPEGKSFTVEPIRTEAFEEAKRYRSLLLDACASADADFEMKYLETGDVTEEDFQRALRKGTLEGTLLPTLGGSALQNRGVQPLLDAVVAYLPAPEEGPPLEDLQSKQQRPRTAEAPLAAFCFKVVFARYGQLTFVRVYSGQLKKGEKVRSSDGSMLRVGRLVRLFADRLEDIELLHAGDIGAILGGECRTGATLTDPDHPITLETVVVPRPVVRLAIEPRARVDRDRLAGALHRMIVEDPSLRLSTDPDTGQTLLGGIGELHLEVTVERLAREHGVEVSVGRPKVAYRETIRKEVSHAYKHVKQTGGPGQWAQVHLAVKPGPLGSGLTFEDRITGGVIAADYIPGVRKGVEEAMLSGILGGYPVTDVEVALVDGAQHKTDSSELAFKVAGGQAFRQAMRLADPALLEPMMDVEVLVSEENLGAVLGELATRRGQVTAMTGRKTTQVVTAKVPLREMFGFASALNAASHGRGQHSMAFSHYAEVPDAIATKLLAREP